MDKSICSWIVFTLLSISFCSGQSINPTVPKEVTLNSKYIFYLHGGIVQAQGPNAVSEYYGPYKYLDILETFREEGYEVISEVRPKGTVEKEYAKKVSTQINELMDKGIPSENIIIVGASLGAYITIEAANILRNQKIKYSVLGLCSEYALELYNKLSRNLCGNFLSIYERSDEKGSCMPILVESDCKEGVKEIMLDMGLGHGFLYKPYDDWVEPLLDWIENG